VVDVKLYGYFTTNGVTSTPTGTDYSYVTWPGWKMTSITASRSATATNSYAWAKFTINSEFYIGIAPVGMTLQTRSNTVYLYVDQNGNYYSQLL